MMVKTLYRKVVFRFLKLLSLFISTMLGIFCNSNLPLYGGPTPLYGMRHADYKISGTVLSSDQNLPIKGLSVSIRDTMNYYFPFDSTKTDSLGKYSLEFSSSPPLVSTWDLNVKDVDSTKNGSFIAKDTIISIPDSTLKSTDDGGYIGAEKTVDIKLDKKE